MIKVYDDKSGNPAMDNRARNANRTLDGIARSLRVHGTKGRKRKKYVLGIERAKYARLVAVVAQEMAQEEAR